MFLVKLHFSSVFDLSIGHLQRTSPYSPHGIAYTMLVGLRTLIANWLSKSDMQSVQLSHIISVFYSKTGGLSIKKVLFFSKSGAELIDLCDI